MQIRFLEIFGLTKLRIAAFLGIAFGAAFFESFGMAMFLPVLDYIEGGEDISGLSRNGKLWKIIINFFQIINVEVSLFSLVFVVFVLIMLRILVMYLRQIYVAWLFQDIPHKVRVLLFKTYMEAEYNFFDRNSTGKIINTITTETQRLSSYFNGLLDFFSNIIVLMSFAVLLAWISLPMTLFAVGFLSFGSIIVTYYIKYTKPISIKVTESNNAFSFFVVEHFMAIRLFKLTANPDWEINLAEKCSIGLRNNNFYINKLKARIGLLLEPMIVLAGIVILFFAVRYQRMTISQVGLFMLILLRIMPLCKELLSSRHTMQGCYGSMHIIKESLRVAEEASEKRFGGGQSRLTHLTDGIILKDITFAYSDQDLPVLKNINLKIPAGKITAIVGPSGAGKSTLVDLLPGLRRPQYGEICFDGHPFRDFDVNSIRKSMAFVSQESEVINDSVKANMLLSNPNANEKDIWNALDKANAKKFIQALPDDLSTVLGEKGVKLSGGQRQRLSLARAFLQNAPILILDEPTSALDSEVERDIQDVISFLRKNEKTTIIIIAHRMSTISNADKIIVMADGRVIQEGSHEQLMTTEAWYSMINELQKK